KAAAAIDFAKWQKPPGRPGRASLRLSLRGSQPVAITDLRFETSDLSGSGSGRFNAEGKLVGFDFRQIVLGKTRLDNVVIGLLGPRLDIRIGGGEFEAERFLGKNALTSQAAEPEKKTLPLTFVADHLDRVVIGPNREIVGVRVSFESDGLHWVKLEGQGTPKGGKPMTIDWLPAPGD